MVDAYVSVGSLVGKLTEINISIKMRKLQEKQDLFLVWTKNAMSMTKWV